MTLEYENSKFEENLTVKSVLKSRLNISNRLITKLKFNKKLFIEKDNEIRMASINEPLKPNEKLIVYIDFDEVDDITPQEGSLEILYEDDYLLAVNKPKDMVVHPCAYHLENTLSNYIKFYLNNNKKIRPINRLDKDTTGIVLFAKNEYIQECFKNLDVSKEYIAIACGILDEKEGTLNFPIARKPESIIEREVNFVEGQEAITCYKVIDEIKKNGLVFSILNVLLKTGRTHQIRVHFSYINHPLLGDSLYGIASDLIDRQALHAYRIKFNHPILNKEIEIIAKLPEDMKSIYDLENVNKTL